MQELQIKVQVPTVCGASSGTANMYREGRFSFQLFSRAMNVYKLLFDPSGFGISYSTILPPPLVFFSGCRVGTGDAVLSISFFLPSWHFFLLWCNSPPAVLCNTITMIVLGQKSCVTHFLLLSESVQQVFPLPPPQFHLRLSSPSVSAARHALQPGWK